MLATLTLHPESRAASRRIGRVWIMRLAFMGSVGRYAPHRMDLQAKEPDRTTARTPAFGLYCHVPSAPRPATSAPSTRRSPGGATSTATSARWSSSSSGCRRAVPSIRSFGAAELRASCGAGPRASGACDARPPPRTSGRVDRGDGPLHREGGQARGPARSRVTRISMACRVSTPACSNRSGGCTVRRRSTRRGTWFGPPLSPGRTSTSCSPSPGNRSRLGKAICGRPLGWGRTTCRPTA